MTSHVAGVAFSKNDQGCVVALQAAFYYTNTIDNLLGNLEYYRKIVDNAVLPVELSENLRQKAKIKATHYSTAIEGDSLKAQHYQNALNYLSWAKSKDIPISVDFMKKVFQAVPFHLNKTGCVSTPCFV